MSEITHKTKHAALLDAIHVVGGIANLRDAINQTLQDHGKPPIANSHIHNWLNRPGGTPPEYAVYISRISGVPKESLTPDFPWQLVCNSQTVAA